MDYLYSELEDSNIKSQHNDIHSMIRKFSYALAIEQIRSKFWSDTFKSLGTERRDLDRFSNPGEGK